MSLPNPQTPRTEDSQFSVKLEKNVFLAIAQIEESTLSTTTTVTSLRKAFVFIRRALVCLILL